MTNYGCGTQKKTDQSKEGASHSFIQAYSDASVFVPPLPDRQEAACCVSSVRVLPGPPGYRGDGLARPTLVKKDLRLKPSSYVR